MKIRKIVIPVLISFAVLPTAAWSVDKGCSDESHYRMISKQELAAAVSSKSAFVIDVNSSDSFKKNHVPTAIHFGANQNDLSKLLPKQKDALVVAYCGGPLCSAWKQAASVACELGYTNVRHFREGITGWVKKD